MSTPVELEGGLTASAPRQRMKRLVTIDQDQSAALVEAMIDLPPWKDQMWSRGALMMAARAIRRGRHLTDIERVENLRKAIWPPRLVKRRNARAAARVGTSKSDVGA